MSICLNKNGFRSCKDYFRSVCNENYVKCLCKYCTNALHKTFIYIRINFIAYLWSGTQTGVRYQSTQVVAEQPCLIKRWLLQPRVNTVFYYCPTLILLNEDIWCIIYPHFTSMQKFLCWHQGILPVWLLLNNRVPFKQRLSLQILNMDSHLSTHHIPHIHVERQDVHRWSHSLIPKCCHQRKGKVYKEMCS